MSTKQGGFLIRFDEEQRASFLQEISSLDDGFSDALSSSDWSVKQWEVCGLLFEPHTITHWALARKGRRVATGKVRVEFIEVVPTRILLQAVEDRIGPQILRNIVRARSGVGGKVTEGTWERMKAAVGEIDPASLAALERLERLRDQSRTLINGQGMVVVAQQRDAVGIALDAFDETGQLRKATLQGWVAPQGKRLSSFIDGLGGVRTIEDQLIARDVAVFPDTDSVRHTAVGVVFGLGERKLEVFNVNRSAIETSLGVDLLYFHEEFDAWTMLQYKAMEPATDGRERSSYYRPNESFFEELDRMQVFRAAEPDAWKPVDGEAGYRLCGDGFYFKLCSRIQIEVLSESLLPGLYLPRQFMEAMLSDSGTLGARGGRTITYENTRRHISNTLFAELVRDGWIGTRGLSSAQVAEIVRTGLLFGRSLVIARSRPPHMQANPAETLATLGI